MCACAFCCYIRTTKSVPISALWARTLCWRTKIDKFENSLSVQLDHVIEYLGANVIELLHCGILRDLNHLFDGLGSGASALAHVLVVLAHDLEILCIAFCTTLLLVNYTARIARHNGSPFPLLHYFLCACTCCLHTRVLLTITYHHRLLQLSHELTCMHTNFHTNSKVSMDPLACMLQLYLILNNCDQRAPRPVQQPVLVHQQPTAHSACG